MDVLTVVVSCCLVVSLLLPLFAGSALGSGDDSARIGCAAYTIFSGCIAAAYFIRDIAQKKKK